METLRAPLKRLLADTPHECILRNQFPPCHTEKSTIELPDKIAHHTSNRTAAGIGWMLLTGVLFVAVMGIVRYLGSDMPAVQAAFYRHVKVSQ